MNLYLFESNAEFLTQAPTDPNGIPIGNGVNECPIAAVSTAHVRAMYKGSDSMLPDRLSVGVKRSIVMRSVIVRAVMAVHRVPPDLRVIPVVVWSKSGKRHLSDDYVLMHSDQEYDVLDRELAEYIAVHRGEHVEVVVSVTRWSVRGADVPPLDLIPVKPNDWMVTEAVKATFDRRGVTGVKLTSVGVV